MCVDFRKLNAITIKDKYLRPLIEEQNDKLGGTKYFTELASGYYQVAAGSIEKTAFVTPKGHYEFLRMPFGLTNVPAVFQRLMDKVLGILKNSIAFPYLDDVIIPSRTIEEGIERLHQYICVYIYIYIYIYIKYVFHVYKKIYFFNTLMYLVIN